MNSDTLKEGKMRCKQGEHGNIDCDRTPLRGEGYCIYHLPCFLRSKIETLTKQLDEVTKVKERYEKALEFYADRNSWKFYSYKNDRKDTIEFSDLGCKSYSSEADYSCSSGGRRAREALNGV